MSEPGRASERTRIQLCGRLSVELDGAELVPRLRGRQVAVLLAYLLLSRDRGVGREELIGAIWPDRAPRSQDGALRTLLSRLRSGLGPEILVGRGELRLDLPEPVWVDVEAAAEQLRRAAQALESDDARSAWALAQVPLNIAGRGLLPGISAPWIEPRRRQLDELRLEALEVIGQAGLRLGGTQLASAERAGRSLIELEPYRESGYVLLMGALEAQGNVAEGLRAFERLRALLREELGSSPSPEARAVHARLLHPGRRPLEPGPRQAADPPPPELSAELTAAQSATLIGRRAELGDLESWWSAEGRERILVLSGEAGIGKTRLLAEAALRVHDGGASVLSGRAPAETLVPYQPFLEAIGAWAFNAPLEGLRATARHSGAELARLIPEIGRRLPELGSPEPGDPETDRYRLFEAVAGLLAEISARRPLLLVLDDLQWADRPTLLLLRHLARAPQASGLRILCAYRAAERFSEAFQAALAALRHERLIGELEVRGLPEADAIALVRLHTPDTPSSAFAHALYAGTEGNPFFIEEFIRHLADSGVRFPEAGARELRRYGLPDGVRGVISRRLERLDDDGLEFLRVAAVIGREFDSALLEEVLGFDENRFLRSLEAALDAGLAAEAPGEPGRYTFAHALVRETLYEGMSSQRRARLHRRVGISLEQLPDAPVGALAHHFTRAAQAQDAERAIRYALEAGAQATAMLANEEAAEHYERALEVLERSAPQDRERRCRLLLELGEARVRSGERPAARGVFREAATIADERGDAELLARAAIGATRRFVQPPGVVDEELIELLERALEVHREPSITRVTLITRLCGALYFSERRDQMRRLSAEATAIAERLGSPEAAALAAAARRRAYWGPGNLERRLADSTALLRAGREADDLELTMQGHAWLVCDLLEVGDRTGVEAQVEAFATAAERLRQPLSLWNVAVWRAMLALLDGDLVAAERLAMEALSSGVMPEGVTAPQYYAIQVLGIRREQARIVELEGPLRQLVVGNPLLPAWRVGLATLLCETGRLEEARAELEHFAPSLAEIPADGDWMITVTLLAEVAAELGDVERCATLYELLAPYRETNVVIGLGALCFGSAARYLGRLALTIGRRSEAIEHLELAVEAGRALRAPVQLAHAQLDHARALGPGPRARALIEEAVATARELDLPLVARRAGGLAAPPRG